MNLGRYGHCFYLWSHITYASVLVVWYTDFMTPLVKFVRENGFDALKGLGIFTYEHSEYPLIGVTYRIDKDKFHPVVRSSRGTVLDKNTLEIVAQPFYRFYNIGEHEDTDREFDFSHSYAYDKEDGSLIIAYEYNGHWLANTSGSFGTGQVSAMSGGRSVGKTFSQVFWETYNGKPLNPQYTYMFELCTPWNRIVKYYETPQVFLLAVRDRYTLEELDHGSYLAHAKELGVSTPKHYRFSSANEVVDYVRSVDTPYYEGVVLRDVNNNRIKVKNPRYVEVHHKLDVNPLEAVLKDEIDEVISYFPYRESELRAVERDVHNEFERLWIQWLNSKDAPTRKEFALSIVGNTPYTSVLFQFYGSEPSKEEMFNAWAQFVLSKGQLIRQD